MSRGGTVDGVRWPTIGEIASAADISPDRIYYHESRHGASFTINGHAIVLEKKTDRPLPTKGQCPQRFDFVPSAPPAPPPEPITRALKDRRLYDERGIARTGVLVRRPA